MFRGSLSVPVLIRGKVLFCRSAIPPLAIGSKPAVLLTLQDTQGAPHEVAAQVEIRSCRETEGRHLVGATITEIDASSRMRLMEWCYVVCSHERLRGRRPAAAPIPESDAIVISLDDYREVTAELQPVALGET